eukprot:Gb_24961 [translate_table: standard]
MDLELRASVVEDTDELAPILHRAFSEFNISVGISPDVDFGTVESAGRELNTLFHSPCCGFTVLDKLSGQPIGAVFLNFPGERVQAVGPVFVDPSCSSKGVGKALMRAAVDKAKATNALSIRLVQMAPNTKSFALYGKVGFRPVECVSYFECSFHGNVHPQVIGMPGFQIRRMEAFDVHSCSMLHKNVTGYERETDIREKFKMNPGNTWVALKDNTLQAYTTGFYLDGHSIATSEEAFIMLFQVVRYQKDHSSMTIHIPGRIYPRLIEWALNGGLQLIRQCWIMVIGEYQEPQPGFVWCPSILG